MNKEQLNAIIDNASEEYLDRFYEILLSEINYDDEAYHKKAYQLLLASLNNPHPDDFFIALCGLSLDSLMEKV